MVDSAIVVTGATGFVGRHLVEALCGRRRVWALARGSPQIRGMTLPRTVTWIPVDIAERSAVDEAVERIRRDGGATTLVHLAGYYDFTGERDPEYERTNVVGMRNVLEGARALGVADFVFASSIAACAFPESGAVLTEESPPAGDTPYAESKRIGERMLDEYRGSFRCWTVRFAAMFSDWAEYEPLFRFIEIWLSRHPRSRILAGEGRSAIPFLHIRDGVSFVQRLLDRRLELDPGSPLLASVDGATTHRELFETVTAAHFGHRLGPVYVPAPLCRSGLRVRDVMGRVTGMHVFERPWMGRFIDLRMAVDARVTRERLGWSPRPRLGILRRIPFQVQNRKAFPAEWQRRNHVALRSVRRHDNLRVHALLERRLDELTGSYVEYVLAPARVERFRRTRERTEEQHRATGALLLQALADSVRTGEKSIFRHACRELATQRLRDDVPVDEVCGALDALSDLSVLALSAEDSMRDWNLALYDHVTMTIQFGIDEVRDVYDEAL